MRALVLSFHALHHGIFARLYELVDMSRLDAHEAEDDDGNRFGNGAKSVLERFRGCECGILFVV